MVMTTGCRILTVIHDDDVRPPAGPGGRLHDTAKDEHAPLRHRADLRRPARPRRPRPGGHQAVNDDVGVRWIYSFLSADKKKTYCLYEAPNPEAIREAAARLGIPADVVVAVDQIGSHHLAPGPPRERRPLTPLTVRH